MTSLTAKRQLAYEHRLNHQPNISLEASQINLNTDEVETKLDLINTNLQHNEFTGSSTTVIAGHATATTITAVDTGLASAPHKINIVGTTTHSNIDNVIEVSLNGTDYFELPNIVVTVTGTKFSAIGDFCFRYLRMKTTDNTGSPITVVVEYAIKNIN